MPRRELGREQEAGASYLLFAFTFQESGIYVFSSHLHPEQISILRFLPPELKCREEALLPQRRTRTALAAVGVRLDPDLYENADWASILRVLIACLLLVLLLLLLGRALYVHRIHVEDYDTISPPYRR